MKKIDLKTSYNLREEQRLKEEYKKPDKVGLTDKQKYIRSIRRGNK